MSDQKLSDITGLLKRATDLLFVVNPKGTSMGVLFGFVIQMLVDLFEPILSRQQIVAPANINVLYYVLFGIFIFNLPSALRRQSLDPQIEAALAAIRKAKKEGNMSAVQVKLMYINLINKAVAQIELDSASKDKIRRVERISGDDGPLHD